MIKRVVEVSEGKRYLSVRYGQLIVRSGDEELGRIPCEDIGMLIVDNKAVTMTQSVFTELLGAGAAVVVCGDDHHPTGMMMPVEANSVQTARMRDQLEAKEPLKKRLWKQLVVAKIRHQAAILGAESPGYEGLSEMAQKVKSGDPDNKEAHASKLFWKYYSQEMEFRRQRYGSAPNNLLNYGYAILRAAVARAIVSAGLNASLGVHHRNKYNAFCLADDVMEPYRGYVDRKVLEVLDSGEDIEELSQPVKARLLAILHEEVNLGSFSGPMLVSMHRTVSSLVKSYSGECEKMLLPVF